jgi:LPS sulfotransferase NodH
MSFEEYDAENIENVLDRFENYENYLDSFITNKDIDYLGNVDIAR